MVALRSSALACGVEGFVYGCFCRWVVLPLDGDASVGSWTFLRARMIAW